MSLEKYVMENILKPIIHSDKEGEYIFEEDYAKLTLSYNNILGDTLKLVNNLFILLNKFNKLSFLFYNRIF